jgi:hypothetical protein
MALVSCYASEKNCNTTVDYEPLGGVLLTTHADSMRQLCETASTFGDPGDLHNTSKLLPRSYVPGAPIAAERHMLSHSCGPTSSHAPTNPTHWNEPDECGEYNWFLLAGEAELQEERRLYYFVRSEFPQQ